MASVNHPTLPVGLQLWTVREAFAQNPLDTLKRVAALGLDGVELAGYGGFSAKQLRQRLADLGLQAPSAHVNPERLLNHFEEELDYALALGLQTLVMPYARFDQDQEWFWLAEQLEHAAQVCQQAGVRLAYHNHAHEIGGTTQTGERVMDAILRLAPSLQAEFDIAWLEAGGVSAADYLRYYAARTPLIHLKDYRPNNSEDLTVELGTGVVVLGEALVAVDDTAVEWIILEQDFCPGDPFDSIRRNLEWLRRHTNV